MHGEYRTVFSQRGYFPATPYNTCLARPEIRFDIVIVALLYGLGISSLTFWLQIFAVKPRTLDAVDNRQVAD